MAGKDLERLASYVDALVRAEVHGHVLSREGFRDLSAEWEGEPSRGLFVTLRVGGELRGCIGSIEASDEVPALAARMAREALRDPRFLDRRVRPAELDRLTTEITLLDPPEEVEGPEDLEPGRDGVVCEFRGRRGVYLPQVAEETGWSPRVLVERCFQEKVGVPPGSWRLSGARIYRLRGRKASAGGGSRGAGDERGQE